MRTVFTIGHSNRTWEEFRDLLRAHGVKRVIDVRSIPRSWHNPQFNQEILRAKLRSAKIGYVHLAKLGGLRHARRDSVNMGWRNTSFRGYRRSHADAGIRSGIAEADQTGARKTERGYVRGSGALALSPFFDCGCASGARYSRGRYYWRESCAASRVDFVCPSPG